MKVYCDFDDYNDLRRERIKIYISYKAEQRKANPFLSKLLDDENAHQFLSQHFPYKFIELPPPGHLMHRSLGLWHRTLKYCEDVGILRRCDPNVILSGVRLVAIECEIPDEALLTCNNHYIRSIAKYYIDTGINPGFLV